MSQFDVHRNTGKNRATIPFVVIVQSSFYSKHRRRVVVPLVAAEGEHWKNINLPRSSVNPVFTVSGVEVILDPLEMTSVALDTLGEYAGSLASESDAIIAALDELFSRAWN